MLSGLHLHECPRLFSPGFSAQPIFSTALMATFNICWCVYSQNLQHLPMLPACLGRTPSNYLMLPSHCFAGLHGPALAMQLLNRCVQNFRPLFPRRAGTGLSCWRDLPAHLQHVARHHSSNTGCASRCGAAASAALHRDDGRHTWAFPAGHLAVAAGGAVAFCGVWDVTEACAVRDRCCIPPAWKVDH